MWISVLDNPCGRLSFRSVESDEICASIFDNSSEWCWCRMFVRWDMQSRMPVSHASLSFGDNWTQGCTLMLRPAGAVWFVMCLLRMVNCR